MVRPFPKQKGRARPLARPFPDSCRRAGTWPDLFSTFFAEPALIIKKAGQFYVDPGPRNVSPLFWFEKVACSILRLNQSHLREVANFKANMDILEKVQELSRAVVCQRQ